MHVPVSRIAGVLARVALGALVAGTTALQAQVPDTDIWLVRLERVGDEVVLGRPANVTRRAGYDNQPSFDAGGTTLFFTRREPNALAPRADRDVQTDIWAMSLRDGRLHAVTRTAESEYSPRAAPDGRGVIVVRVELDSAQHLWRMPLDPDAGLAERLVPTVRPVGYYAWRGPRVAMYVLGRPMTLQVMDTLAARIDTIARDVGRSVQPVPGAATVSYVQHDSAAFTLMELDPATRAAVRLVPMPARVDDHAWMDYRTVLASDGTRLFLWRRGAAEWRRIADFTDAPFRNVSRLAVDPQGRTLALVAEPR
ncbi:MAG: hypothetical protein MUF21_10305 [Gemmatimonadaceae bacterium]|nr:hypothetical protein [Gemmatimonadaceae bacterium]MCU0626856.1 hypothetical protein [Gemmatimonadaceae bacterium]